MDPKKKNGSVFSTRLTFLRRASGMTQKQIAQSLSIDRSTFAYYEGDKTKPDYETLVRIAKIFQVSCDYLLGLTDDIHPTAVSEMREPPINYGSPLAGASSLFSLPDDEKSFLIMFRQMDTDQRQKLLEFALSQLQTPYDSESDS